MITRERLEELIKQGATIYSTHWKEEVDLSKKCEVVKKSFYDWKKRLVLIVHEDEEHSPHYMLENLTEDVEGATWEEEFGCIERTERLELPTWEEFDKKGYFEFVSADGTKLVLEKTLMIDCDKEPISCYVLEILVNDYDHRLLFEAEYTKENYTKACREVKELFLGETE